MPNRHHDRYLTNVCLGCKRLCMWLRQCRCFVFWGLSSRVHNAAGVKGRWQERGGSSGYSTSCTGAATSPTAVPIQFQVSKSLCCLVAKEIVQRGYLHTALRNDHHHGVQQTDLLCEAPCKQPHALRYRSRRHGAAEPDPVHKLESMGFATCEQG